VSRTVAVSAPRDGRTAAILARVDGPALAAWVLPFALVLYLALQSGGYDAVVRGQVGVAVWWIVLLGAAVGVLPRTRIGAAGWIGLGLLGMFALWTGLSVNWTESRESTVAELGRVSLYLGVLALALCAGRRSTLRRMVDGVACAIAVVAFIAVLSRLQPQLFPASPLPDFFGNDVASRLSYPIDYWNGLAAFVAIGAPLVLRAATEARSLVMQALAAAAVPVIALTVFMAVSRGGVVVFVIAAAAWALLSPNRLPKLPTVLVCGVGSALLIAGADQRDAVQEGVVNAALREQGDQLLAMLVVVCAGVALVQLAVGLTRRHVERPRWSVVPRPAAAGMAVTAAVAAGVIALAAGAPTWADRQWQGFKERSPSAQSRSGTDSLARFASTSGTGRYQHWQEAARAHATAPLTGIGAGAYEYWWARNTDEEGFFVRDAHSLYLETLGELGWIGLVLIGGFLGLTLVVGVWRAMGTGREEHRAVVAAATAGVLAFAAAAAAEWVWELPALTAAALVLAAVVLAGARDSAPGGRARLIQRGAIVALSVAGLVAVAIPLAGAAGVRGSEGYVRDGDLVGGLREARAATAVQPYNASGHLQEALVFERAGAFGRAAAAAREATVHEPTNWRTWLVRSRIQALRGNAEASVESYREARRLNPRSPIFQEP
jgi:hypothetical protein